MTTFNLPDLGEGLAEAEIVRWHVNVGDAVTVDQPMLAVETAKAVVEVPAPFSGVVKALHGQPGDIIATGAPLIEFEASKTPQPAVARATATDSGTVVGNMPTSDDELIETAHAGGRANAANANASNGSTPHSQNGDGRLRAAPAARALAKKLGIDLTQLTGSGPGGVVIVDDVIAHSSVTRSLIANSQPPGAQSTAGTGTNGPSKSAAPAASAGTIVTADATAHSLAAPAASTRAPPAPNRPHAPAFTGGEQLRGMRRAMAQSMTLAHNNVANCTIFDDADLHKWREGQDFTTRLLRAIAAGCQAEPALNAWYDGTTQTRRLMQRVDIGMAVDTADGLIVPVVRDVGAHSAKELRQEIDRLKRASSDRTVTPDDLREATFMLSNFGMIAGRYATPVVVPPTVAILGSGRLSRDVVAVNDRIEAHLRMPLSLTFDHRCVTGGEAARFMAATLRDLEKDN